MIRCRCEELHSQFCSTPLKSKLIEVKIIKIKIKLKGMAQISLHALTSKYRSKRDLYDKLHIEGKPDSLNT